MASAPVDEPFAKHLLMAAEETALGNTASTTTAMATLAASPATTLTSSATATTTTTAMDTTVEEPAAVPVLNSVLIKIGKDGRYTEPDFPSEELLPLCDIELLETLQKSDCFKRRLQHVDLTDVDVHLLRSVAGKLPTVAEELNFVDLVSAWTIGSKLSQIDLGANGWLYIHVILPATPPAALPVVAGLFRIKNRFCSGRLTQLI
jgi:hypothetical protein